MDEYRAKQLVEERKTMRKVQKTCDEKNLPYPPEVIQWLTVLREAGYQ